MTTLLKDKNGKKYTIRTQQYDLGLTYVIVNDDPSKQFATNLKEEKYHISIRRKFLKDDGKILGGDVIKGYKGKYPINEFKK